MLNVVRHAIDIYAPATAIPNIFEIDVTGLEIGDAIHVSSIALPDGVTLVTTDRDYTVATIAAPSALKSSDDAANDEADAADAADDGEAAEAAEGADGEDGGDSES